MSSLNIAVLGAGVVGLTTGLELQNQFNGANVSIFADKFYKDTTSFVAAGLFRPGTSFCGSTEEITRHWIKDAYSHWDSIRLTSEGPKAGVTQLSGYIFSSEFPGLVRNHYIEDVVPLYRKATEEELKLCPGNWKYGSFFTTVLTECNLYLPWATKKFLRNGGTMIEESVSNLTRFGTRYDIVMNCTGLGAKFLCNDHKLVPIRGQVLKAEAPWVKTFFYGDYDTYIIPGFSTVTLGGCRNYDSYNTGVSRHDEAAILERCEALLPSLKGSNIVAQRVGLRPHRDPVRVEKEVLQSLDGKTVKIVHNYGHGGYGVTTAPGTAVHAVKLAKELHVGNSKL